MIYENECEKGSEGGNVQCDSKVLESPTEAHIPLEHNSDSSLRKVLWEGNLKDSWLNQANGFSKWDRQSKTQSDGLASLISPSLPSLGALSGRRKLLTKSRSIKRKTKFAVLSRNMNYSRTNPTKFVQYKIQGKLQKHDWI